MTRVIKYLSRVGQWYGSVALSRTMSQAKAEEIAAQTSVEENKVTAIFPSRDALHPTSVFIHGTRYERPTATISNEVYYFRDAAGKTMSNEDDVLYLEFTWNAAKELAESLLKNPQQELYGMDCSVIWVYRRGEEEACGRLDDINWQVIDRAMA